MDKSLVVAEAWPGTGGALRYKMLEPVRQYAREKLGHTAAHLGDRNHEQVTVRVEESMAMLGEIGDLRGVAMCLTALGMDALEQRDSERVRRRHSRRTCAS